MWTIFFLNSLLNLLQYCFCFWFCGGHMACGILGPQPGIEPVPSALEGEVLTTAPPGKSHWHSFRIITCCLSCGLKITNLPWWLRPDVKHLPTMREIWVRSLGQEDPLEKEMATLSSTLAWKIPWTEEPGR